MLSRAGHVRVLLRVVSLSLLLLQFGTLALAASPWLSGHCECHHGPEVDCDCPHHRALTADAANNPNLPPCHRKAAANKQRPSHRTASNDSRDHIKNRCGASVPEMAVLALIAPLPLKPIEATPPAHVPTDSAISSLASAEPRAPSLPPPKRAAALS